jgi:hypothetical protein
MSGTQVIVADRLRAAAAVRGEELLAEIPGAVRRVGVLMVVLAISVPAFLVGCFGLLAWWLLA